MNSQVELGPKEALLLREYADLDITSKDRILVVVQHLAECCRTKFKSAPPMLQLVPGCQVTKSQKRRRKAPSLSVVRSGAA